MYLISIKNPSMIQEDIIEEFRNISRYKIHIAKTESVLFNVKKVIIVYVASSEKLNTVKYLNICFQKIPYICIA